MTRNVGVGQDLRPVDPYELLERLHVSTGQAAAIAGVSVRQLSYWTDKGYVEARRGEKGRVYGFRGIEKAALIKRALDEGHSLEEAATQAEANLCRREQKRRTVEQLSEGDLEQFILFQASQLQQVADRIRSEVDLAGESEDVLPSASMLGSTEAVLRFFQSNPYTVNTAHQIAARLGRELDEVGRSLEYLERRRIIQRISYPGAEVYRYIPQRHHS
jgi:DNA-binding transcriptional MerR regulator